MEFYIEGVARRFGNDINTDYIISGKYKFKTLDMNELAKHIMEDVHPNFYDELTGRDIIVAGKNFGCGSSREQAPLALKFAGIKGVVAKSFARIFYRNAINIGLPLIECDTTDIEEGDELRIDLKNGEVMNLTKSRTIKISPLSEAMFGILSEGGLVNYLKNHKGFEV
ncbi:MAG: 3-isopropylmalate dehydratase small subunit [Actinobacteria bacterium]|nr:3-isopropylmalate dehydratase small subunit [Actinomycetota bacterium]